VIVQYRYIYMCACMRECVQFIYLYMYSFSNNMVFFCSLFTLKRFRWPLNGLSTHLLLTTPRPQSIGFLRARSHGHFLNPLLTRKTYPATNHRQRKTNTRNLPDLVTISRHKNHNAPENTFNWVHVTFFDCSSCFIRVHEDISAVMQHSVKCHLKSTI
jgi:hypothetical protein